MIRSKLCKSSSQANFVTPNFSDKGVGSVSQCATEYLSRRRLWSTAGRGLLAATRAGHAVAVVEGAALTWSADAGVLSAAASFCFAVFKTGIELHQYEDLLINGNEEREDKRLSDSGRKLQRNVNNKC